MNEWNPTRKQRDLFVHPEARFQSVGPGTNFFRVVIPEPYPIVPPPGQEVVDAYYVVDHGREVRIFIDK
jgi:hypothetical protein